MHGQNYWETYSPVVNALTVKLLLVIAKMHGLVWDDTAASYELQVRGVNAPTPTFVLRMPKAGVKLLKDGWAKKPVAATLPACLA